MKDNYITIITIRWGIFSAVLNSRDYGLQTAMGGFTDTYGFSDDNVVLTDEAYDRPLLNKLRG